MDLEVSNKQGAGFGRNPHIKKGYYPAQLIKVEKFTDKDGNLKEGKYGNQLILSFRVFKADSKTDEPVEVMKFTDDSLGCEIESDVVIPKFVYYIYKDQKSGEKQTALTPNSAITKVFKALGWEFDASKAFDPESFVGNWAEVNLDDYERKDKDDKAYTASTIQNINVYKGPAPKVGDKKTESELPDEVDMSEESDLPDDVKTRIAGLKKSHEDGLLSKEGFEQAVKKLKE